MYNKINISVICPACSSRHVIIKRKYYAMKKIYYILTLLLLFQLASIFGEHSLLVSSANAEKTNYNINSEKVLLTANEYNYTEGHFNKELRFIEFLLGTPISPTERQEGLQETSINFNNNPAGVLQEVNQIDSQMQQIYQITDVSQIGRMRSALISQIYGGAQNMQGQRQPFIVRLLYKYVPVLAIDPQNMLAFTYKDFEESDVVVFIVANPAIAHPIMWNRVKKNPLLSHIITT